MLKGENPGKIGVTTHPSSRGFLVSAQTDGEISCAPILHEATLDEKQTTEETALSDLSPRDKPWDKHRKNADTVSDYYRIGCMDKYSERVNLCSQLLDFRLVPDADLGELKLKLSSAKFCRVRHCPVCQWRRSLMWKAKAYQALPKVVEAFPRNRWLFLTLTARNCDLNELRSTLHHLNQSFKRLTERKIFPGLGWIKSVEVTRGRDGQSAHPHLHILMMVKPSFFKKHYLSQKKWCELWQSCLRVDYQPILDVQAVKPDKSPVILLSEVLKYQTKESDLVADPQWFCEYVRQLHKTRAVSVGGLLIDYFRDLEREPEDLIGKDDAETGVDEGHLYFGWEKRDKKYKMI